MNGLEFKKVELWVMIAISYAGTEITQMIFILDIRIDSVCGYRFIILEMIEKIFINADLMGFFKQW